MPNISKSKLKPKLLAYLRQVQDTQEPLTITDHNIPVLQIIPFIAEESTVDIFKPYQGKVRYTQNIWDPAPEDWGDLA